MFLLDTNVVSEFRKSRPHGGVVAWTQSVSAASLHISAVTFGELQVGIERTRLNNQAKAAEIESWIERDLIDYNILPVTAQIFRLWANLVQGKTNTLIYDAMIAATAVQHDLTVVTRDVDDFALFPVKILNPFEHK